MGVVKCYNLEGLASGLDRSIITLAEFDGKYYITHRDREYGLDFLNWKEVSQDLYLQLFDTFNPLDVGHVSICGIIKENVNVTK